MSAELWGTVSSWKATDHSEESSENQTSPFCNHLSISIYSKSFTLQILFSLRFNILIWAAWTMKIKTDILCKVVTSSSWRQKDHFKWTGEEPLRNAKCEKKKTKKKIKRNKTNNHIQSVQSFFFYLLANSANLSVQCWNRNRFPPIKIKFVYSASHFRQNLETG